MEKMDENEEKKLIEASLEVSKRVVDSMAEDEKKHRILRVRTPIAEKLETFMKRESITSKSDAIKILLERNKAVIESKYNFEASIQYEKRTILPMIKEMEAMVSLIDKGLERSESGMQLIKDGLIQELERTKSYIENLKKYKPDPARYLAQLVELK